MFIIDEEIGIVIYDISDFPSSEQIGSILAYDPISSEIIYPIAISVSNNFIYLGCGYGGLRAINITDINNPQYVGKYKIKNCYVNDVKTIDEIVFVSDLMRNLDVIKLKNLDNNWPPTSIPTEPNTIGFFIIIIVSLPILYLLVKKHNRKNK